jgi:ADP-heptose:LPS heptosyltransferase
MMTYFETATVLDGGIVSHEPLRIYTGLLGQIGDIVMYTATARRIKELFPNSTLTFAVSKKYREAGLLVEGLPYVDRLFVTELYYDKLYRDGREGPLYNPFHLYWPVELRGDDEIEEHRKHDIVTDTRPRHKRMPWWQYAHQVAELAHEVGVPGPIDLRTEVVVPPGTSIPEEARGKIVLHNDPSIDATKAWPWEYVQQLVAAVGAENVVLLGNPGPAVPGALDLRGATTLCEAAAVIQACACYVGIDSGLMWIAGSLAVPTVGLYGTSYIPAYEAIQPKNPNALYLQTKGDLSGIIAEAVVRCVRHKISKI